MARRTMVGRRPQWRRAVAAAQAARLSRMPSGCRRVDDAAPEGRQSRDGLPQPHAIRPDDRTADDHRTGSVVEGRNGDGRHDRSQHAPACRSPGPRSPFSRLWSVRDHRTNSSPGLTRQGELGRLLRKRRRQRRDRGPRGDDLTLVEWPDRGPNHQTEARQTTNVWARKTRSPSSSRHRPSLNACVTKIASEPLFHAEITDMTAHTTRATPKITLDQRAPSRQERAGGRLDDSAHLTHIWGFLEARSFFVHGRNPTTAKTRCREHESGVGRNEARAVCVRRKTASNLGRGGDRES